MKLQRVAKAICLSSLALLPLRGDALPEVFATSKAILQMDVIAKTGKSSKNYVISCLRSAAYSSNKIKATNIRIYKKDVIVAFKVDDKGKWSRSYMHNCTQFSHIS